MICPSVALANIAASAPEFYFAAKEAASILATFMAYAYRVHVEDAMLVAAFGEEYERYRREVGALIPFTRPRLSGSVIAVRSGGDGPPESTISAPAA